MARRKGETVTITKKDIGVLKIGKSGTPRIVEAAASVAGRGISGRKDQVASMIENAMATAVQMCYDRGIRDPNVIRATQLKARELALAEINKKLAAE